MKTNLRRAVVLAGLLPLATLVAACGKTSSPTSTAASATTTAKATGSSGGSTATTTGSSSGSSSDDSTPDTVKATGGGSFCKKLAASVNQAQLDPGTTPAQLKAEFQKLGKEMDEAVSEAPNAIKPDLKIIQGALKQELAAMAKANYDFTKIDPTAFSAIDTPAITAASDRVDAYVKKRCGIDVSGGDSTTPTTP